MLGKYVHKGMPKHSRGQYDLVVCVNWVIEGLREQRDSKVDSNDLSKERLKLYRAQREKTDLETARMRGELLPVEDVANAFNAMAAEVASRLDSVGGRLASTLAGMNNPGEIQTLLLEEMRTIRAGIARSWHVIADGTDSGDDSGAAA